MKKKDIVKYVESQQSLHLYANVREAFVEVLSKFSDDQFNKIRDGLLIMAFHEGINGQVMHFDPIDQKFAVMQLYLKRDMPDDVLRFVIAHELGHVLQGRNWVETDGEGLELSADEFARNIGYAKTDIIKKWLAENRREYVMQ